MGFFTPKIAPEVQICEYVEDVDNLPTFIECNMSLSKMFPDEQYDHCVKIEMEIYMKDIDNGLVSDAELAQINMIESMISERIEGIYAGRGIVCSKGYAYLMYYISKKNARKASSIFNALLNSSFRHTETDILYDPKGKEYFDLIYPNEYQFKTIETQNVIRKLKRYGDDGEQPRDIKFSLTFPNKEAVVAFASEAFKNNFAYVDMTKETVAERVLPLYKVVLKTNMPFKAELVNSKIKYLMELSEKFAGEFKSVETNIEVNK